MRKSIYIATALAAALGAASIASAAQQVNLSTSQKQQIRQDLSTTKAQSAPSSFQAMVGHKVPSSITLQKMPSTAPSKVKSDMTAKLDNGDIIIADSSSRKVVAVIQSSTTGRSAAEPMHTSPSTGGNYK